MDRTQHVLDAIDGALEDRTVSGDAMRWTPEPERHSGSRLIAGPVVLHTAPAGTQPADTAAWAVHQVLERSIWTSPSVVDAEQSQRILERIGLAMQPVLEAAERMAAGLGRSMEELTQLLAGMMRPLADPRPEPEDPRERALRLRQQRHTGPDRDIVHQRRPRQHQR